MTHRLPCFALRRSFLLSLGFGLLAGLVAPDAPAAPPAPVAPVTYPFTDNSNGTVTDNLTGLVWLKNANCFGTPPWTTALSLANGLANGNCGLSDGSLAGQWRLPNRNELQSLIDYNRAGPALPVGHPFTGVQSNYYWSSTTNASDTGNAWCVDLNGGCVVASDKTNNYYVWPVRGGL